MGSILRRNLDFENAKKQSQTHEKKGNQPNNL